MTPQKIKKYPQGTTWAEHVQITKMVQELVCSFPCSSFTCRIQDETVVDTPLRAEGIEYNTARN